MNKKKVGPLSEQFDFLTTDELGNIVVKAECHFNKKERPFIRTRAER